MGSVSSSTFCCEDHFNLENDVVNMVQHKLTGCKLKLKHGVLPSIFDCQKNRQCFHSTKRDHSCVMYEDKKSSCCGDKKKSLLRKERAWRRERKKIVADLLRASSTESKESDHVSELKSSSASTAPLLPDEDQTNNIKIKNEICDTMDMDTKAEALEKVVIKEEPKSDSEISESEESELNYVLDMVMQENKEHEENSSSYSSETNQDSAVPEFSLEFLNEENAETVLPDEPAVSGCEEMNSNESSTTFNETLSFRYQQPSRLSNWEGDYAFKIKVSCESSGKNSFSVYSDILKKLFISKDVGFRILVYAENVPPGCKLRASAIFSQQTRKNDIVTRCPAHAQEDRLKGMKHYFHVVQSVTSQALYEMDLATGQFSVVVPYEEPQKGELYTVYGYKLTCFNSCSRGINRRPFVILYTLEKNGVVLGKYTVDVKVCACPTRDLRLELLRLQSNSPDSKPDGENCDETKTYSLTVDNADLYKFLNQMKVLYESSDFVKCVTNMGE
ncbi:cellular tumor antigen p53-like isoform X2 [Uloborus diversus]|uniref:cellular tumor antigen p53-like isoform X2 n=1 Tax=Uloborus diversus TaxID=327109 RepID=UPI00240A53AF|nr:cellular tumor antigen p53-like isoform X2 [Uloborus diversus]